MDKRYMISEASKLVGVESHVLRYWEEELEIKIGRNEMGHRYYTERDIGMFQAIRRLKGEGYGLKAVKHALPEILESQDQGKEGQERKSTENIQKNVLESLPEDQKGEGVLTVEQREKEQEEKDPGVVVETIHMEKFKEMITQIIHQSLVDNNLVLGREIGKEVTTQVVKEWNYRERNREEQEEERFRKLDETIRAYQRGREEAAATKEKKPRRFSWIRRGKRDKNTGSLETGSKK